MDLLYKSAPIIDAKADAETGTFEATVAIFGNVDSGGDRIQPGAFDRTLAQWRESGDPIPVILSHQWNDPFKHIGIVNPEDATQTDKGLHVKGQLDVGTNDVARQVHMLMARRSLKEFSFGYRVFPGGQKKAKDGALDLTSIDLAEIGPTLKGLNPDTELHSVKSALGIPDDRPDPEEQDARAKAVEAEEGRMPAAPGPVEIKCSAGHVMPGDPLPGQTLLPCGCALETATDEAKAAAALSAAPSDAVLRAKAAAVEAEAAAEEEARRIGEPPPPAAPEPPAPAPAPARRPAVPAPTLKAVAERIDAEERAREEAARIGEVPPAPPEPEPEPEPEPLPAARSAAELRAAAEALEREERRERLAAEAARAGEMPPAPPPEPEPEPAPQPELTPAQLRRVAEGLEREERRERLAAEAARAGEMPPEPPPEPEPPARPQPTLTPEQLRQRADRLEAEARADAEAARIGAEPPEAPPEPEPQPKAKPEPPEPQAQRRRAGRISREEQRRIDDARAGEAPPRPQPRRKALQSNVRERLQQAGVDRWGDDATRTWAYIDDWDPEAGYAIYCVSSPDSQEYYRVDYTLGADGTVTLGETETEVVRQTVYAPASKATPLPDEELRRLTKAAERLADADRAGRVPDAGGPPRIAPELPFDTDAEKAHRLLDSKALADGTVMYVRCISPEEHAGVGSGLLKAVWSKAYVDSLPDSAFLFVGPGGTIDAEGKTLPRSLRRFPYRDAEGALDLPHLRNDLAVIPQSNLSEPVKERLCQNAQRILDAQKADATGRRPVDPLRAEADAVALEFASGGESLRQHNTIPAPKQHVAPSMSLEEMRQRMRDEMLTAVSGGIT